MPSQREILQGQIDEQAKIFSQVEKMLREANDIEPYRAGQERSARVSALIETLTAKYADDRQKLQTLHLQMASVEDSEAQENRRHEREDAAWWFRRFHTSLAIAHGAAFAAMASNVFGAENLRQVAGMVAGPMVAFGVGMVLAGAIPLALYLKSQRWAWVFAASSAAAFVAGIYLALIEVLWSGGLISLPL